MENIFCCVNSKFISELIKDSKERIIYVSPGINQEVFGAILGVKDDVGESNICIIIDADTNVLRYGYGDEESVSFMDEMKNLIRCEKGIRIGFICVDKDGFVFTPIPLSIEDETNDHCNAIIVKGAELEKIINSIVPKTLLDQDKVEIGKYNIKAEEIKKIKDNIENKPITKPDLQRQINVINSKFQIVKLDFEGSKLRNKTFKIDAKELGITNKEIAEKISTTYKIFKSLTLPIEIENLEIDLSNIKKSCLKQVDNVGLLLVNENYKEFIDEIDKFRSKIIEIREKCDLMINRVLDKSVEGLINFIVSNLMKLSLKEKEKIISYEKPTKENLRIHVENKIRREFPKATDLLSKIELNMKIFNISEQLMNDKNFVEKIEKHFGKSFDEIANIEKAVGTREEKNDINKILQK